MERTAQQGSTLVETAVAVAIVTTVAGTALSAAIVAGKSAAMHPLRDALQLEVERQMPLALDVLKYRGTRIRPAAVATTVPMPAGSPLAAAVSIAVSPGSHGELRVTIAASAIARPDERAALQATLDERAPLPGTVVVAPLLAPAPTGAP